MEKQTLKFVNKSPNENPKFADMGSSGFDVRAWVEENDGKITLKPLERKLIHTGLYFDVPKNCEIQVRPRSGLAIKQGITVINTPGTVDSSYIGELGVLIINLSSEEVTIENGDRIAQAVLCPVYNGYLTYLESVNEITKVTERGDGAYGHSGLK